MLGLPAARSAFQRASKSPVRPGTSSTRMPYWRSKSRAWRSVAAPGAPKNDHTSTPSFFAAATVSSHDFVCATLPPKGSTISTAIATSASPRVRDVTPLLLGAPGPRPDRALGNVETHFRARRQRVAHVAERAHVRGAEVDDVFHALAEVHGRQHRALPRPRAVRGAQAHVRRSEREHDRLA